MPVMPYRHLRAGHKTTKILHDIIVEHVWGCIGYCSPFDPRIQGCAELPHSLDRLGCFLFRSLEKIDLILKEETSRIDEEGLNQTMSNFSLRVAPSSFCEGLRIFIDSSQLVFNGIYLLLLYVFSYSCIFYDFLIFQVIDIDEFCWHRHRSDRC